MTETNTGWQPIETSPRDGQWFICWSRERGVYPAAWFEMVGHDTKTLMDADGNDLGIGVPELWQPLPQAPRHR